MRLVSGSALGPQRPPGPVGASVVSGVTASPQQVGRRVQRHTHHSVRVSDCPRKPHPRRASSFLGSRLGFRQCERGQESRHSHLLTCRSTLRTRKQQPSGTRGLAAGARAPHTAWDPSPGGHEVRPGAGRPQSVWLLGGGRTWATGCPQVSSGRDMCCRSPGATVPCGTRDVGLGQPISWARLAHLARWREEGGWQRGCVSFGGQGPPIGKPHQS